MMELVKNLKVESVSRLHPPPARRVDAGGTVADAVAVMQRERVGCLVVVGGERLVGIFTERDLLTRVLAAGEPLSTPIASVMTANPVAVNAKDPIRTAITRMQAGGYRHLPVVDEHHRPIAIVSAKRIVHYLVEHFPSTVYNLPPDPNRVPDTAEGA